MRYSNSPTGVPCRLLAPLALASLLAGAGHAQVSMEMLADGAQNGNPSAGIASGTFVLDTAANTLDFNIQIQSLDSAESFSVIHGPGVPGVAGPGVFTLPNGNSKVGTWTYLESEEADLVAGLMYVDIHSMTFPGGEIRGQITYTPVIECDCTSTLGPCGNDATAIGAGCTNSAGGGAQLRSSGLASVGLDNLGLTATGLPANQFGIFFMGMGATQSAFGDGLRCAGGQTFRFPVQNTGSAGALSVAPGVVGYSAANFTAAGQIQSGQTWRFQAWFRDPTGPCGSGFNTSNGLAVTFTP